MIMTCKVALVVDVFLVDSIQDPAWGAKPSLPAWPAGWIFVLVYKSLPTFVFYASVCCGWHMIYFPAARSHRRPMQQGSPIQPMNIKVYYP